MLVHSALLALRALHAHSTLHEMLAWLGLRFRVRVRDGVRVRVVLGFDFGLGLVFALHAHSQQDALLAHCA